jgi:hypothetical protein
MKMPMKANQKSAPKKPVSKPSMPMKGKGKQAPDVGKKVMMDVMKDMPMMGKGRMK